MQTNFKRRQGCLLTFSHGSWLPAIRQSQKYEKTAIVVLRPAVFYKVLRKTLCHSRLFQPLSVSFASVLGAFVTLTASESSTPDTFEGIAGLRKNILIAVPTAVINTGKFQDMPERGFGFLINLFIGGSSVQFYVRDASLNIYCRDINGGSGIVSSWFKLTNTQV